MEKKYVRLAIVGGRDFQNYAYMQECLSELQKEYTIIGVISGGAKGADTLGEKWADQNKITKRIFPADWEKYGKSAGMRRNKDIVDNADIIAAFWDGKSRGTANTIERARLSRKILKIYKY